jgi:photosystem II stability/assembly factor-like uncharacterized protein
MKKTHLIVFLLACVSIGNSQVKVPGKQKKDVAKPVSNPRSGSNSVISLIEIADMTLSSDGTLFVGGRLKGKGLLLNISPGNSMKIRTLSYTDKIRRIFFTDDRTGWFADNNYLYRSEDGGDHWAKFTSLSTTSQGGMFFLDRQMGWVADTNGALYAIESNTPHKITDGSRWTTKKIQFVDRYDGWRTKYDFNKHVFEYTGDSGKTWREVKIGDDAWIPDFQFINGNQGFVLDSDGRVYSTGNGGVTWDLIKTESGKYFNTIFFTDSKNGWIAGDDVCRTGDGGENWECTPFSFGYILQIVFRDYDRGWVRTDTGLYATEDMGKTWSEINIPLK